MIVYRWSQEMRLTLATFKHTLVVLGSSAYFLSESIGTVIDSDTTLLNGTIVPLSDSEVGFLKEGDLIFETVWWVGDIHTALWVWKRWALTWYWTYEAVVISQRSWFNESGLSLYAQDPALVLSSDEYMWIAMNFLSSFLGFWCSKDVYGGHM